MTAHGALPDLLGRADEPHGSWEIQPCAPVRGEPGTSIIDRVMIVPPDDNDKGRVIRAHEMMHARVTPGTDWTAWVARGQASERALRAAEEFRVNWLCQQVGFDVKTHLADGDEKSVGARIAEAGDWAEAVYFAAACAGTASMNPYLTGIRRHRREWAPVLREVERHLRRQARKVGREQLADTLPSLRAQLSPAGFLHTEAWAVMLDRIARSRDETAERERAGRSATSPSTGERSAEVDPSEPPVSVDEIRGIAPEVHDGEWGEVRVKRMPLTRPSPGGMGRRRRASDRGRAPRRIHRMLTDPQRRVFDQHRRGNGGVVLVDGSGSMNLTEAHLRQILEAAPGATVAVYACSTGEEPENLWVLADQGRMTEVLPDRPAGNGVDYTAALWAVAQRQHQTAPVVWVTDGIVHTPHGSCSDRARLDCAEVARKHNVVVRPDVESAVVALRQIASRRRVPAWWPYSWREAWKEVLGVTVSNEATIVRSS